MRRTISLKKVTKNGQERWLVDARKWGLGRRYFPDRFSAATFLSQTARERAQFGQLAFDLPHEERVRYLSIHHDLAHLGCTIEEVIRFWKENHGIADPKPLGEAIAACIEAKRASGRKARTTEQLRYSLLSLQSAVGEQTNCSDVNCDHISRWLDNPNWGLRTRKGKLTDARTFFSFAKKRGWVSDDPCGRLENFILDPKPPGILTVQQVVTLLQKCEKERPALLAWVTIGIFCGVRPEELQKLRWENVDLKSGYVEIPASIAKVRKRRLIKLQANAVEWLRKGGGMPPRNRRRSWIRVRKLAGFAIESEDAGVPWPHDAMRHSFCSYAIPMFGAAQTAEWAGNSEQMLFQHYRELVRKEEAEKFWQIVPANS